MDALHRAVERIARWGAWFGGALLVASILGVGAEVFIRAVYGSSFGGIDELSGYALATGSTWAFAYALVQRQHIRIDTLYVVLPNAVRAILDVVALVGMIAFFAVVTWYGWEMLVRSIAIGQRAMTPLRTPLAYPQALWLAGLVAFLAIALFLLVRAVVALVRGDIAEIAHVAGSRTAQEDLDEELAAVEARRHEAGR